MFTSSNRGGTKEMAALNPPENGTNYPNRTRSNAAHVRLLSAHVRNIELYIEVARKARCEGRLLARRCGKIDFFA